MASYKEEHEKFVSDNMGTSLQEIMFVVGSAPFAVFVRNLVAAWLFIEVKNPSFVQVDCLQVHIQTLKLREIPLSTCIVSPVLHDNVYFLKVQVYFGLSCKCIPLFFIFVAIFLDINLWWTFCCCYCLSWPVSRYQLIVLRLYTALFF